MKNEMIVDLLKKHSIDTVGFLPFERCRITLERRLAFIPEKTRSVIIMAIPYMCRDKVNVSAYAVPMDYHYYVKTLSDKLVPELEKMFEGERFYLCADTSPIDEREAAARSGIGVFGRNSLLITEKYSSYIFIAEIFTTLELDSTEVEIGSCEGCGKCDAICPSRDFCLSAITQKKGTLSKKEAELIRESGVIWGCDLCQDVCPHSERASETPIEFFRINRTPLLSTELLENMSDEEFSKRAYSWRGRKTVERNLDIMENKRILFVGNSYTYFNDLPLLFEALANENGFLCKADSVTSGGYWLTSHADPSDECGKKINEYLSEKKYDIAILQDNSMAAVKDPERFSNGVSALCEKLVKNGAKTFIYQTWGRKEGSKDLEEIGMSGYEMSLEIEKKCAELADRLGCLVAPVGKYFRALDGKNGIDLFDPDRSHPSFEGSYLAACVMLDALFGVKPLYPVECAVLKIGAEKERLIRESV